jgi:site-specific DNA-methyltransferase (adenine-specific)
VRFLVLEYKTGTKGNSKELFSKIPLIDFTRMWSDDELYTHFGLTQEEIKYIEETTK